jgi:tetratricopeptide (TPR) repeat protein
VARRKTNPQISRAPFVSVYGERRTLWPGYIGLLALTVLVYAPTYAAGFVWNDADYVTRPELRTIGGLWRIWFEVGATEQYYPLLHSVFWVQSQLWGDSALGYHLSNVLLHAVNACLLVVLVGRVWVIGSDGSSALGPRSSVLGPVAWLSGVLFAVHPVFVESVAWVSEQKNTLSLFFYLLAAIAYLRWEAGGRTNESRGQRAEGGGWWPVAGGRRGYFLATGLFVLAILSKSLTATLPAALLVVLWWRRGSLEWKRDWVPLMPWFVLGAGIGAFTGWVEHTYIGAQGEDFALGFIERGVLAGRVIWFYIGKLAWPVELIFIYPRWEVDAGSVLQWIFPVLAVGTLIGLWVIRRRTRGPLAAYLLYTGSLFPTMGFFNVYAFQFSYVADHWNYLPAIALLVGAAWTAVWLWQRYGSRTGTGLGIAMVVTLLLSVQSWRHTHGYRDMETFYRTILEKNSNSWLALNNLGRLEGEQGRLDSAMTLLEEAIRHREDDPEPHTNYAAVLARAGREDEGAAHLRSAIPRFAEPAAGYFALGNYFAALDRWGEAVQTYEEALRMNPTVARIEYNLGVSLIRMNRQREAIAHFESALRLQAEYPEAEQAWGLALLSLGEAVAAIPHLERAVEGAPRRPDARVTLAVALANVGRFAESIEHLERTIELNPAYPEAYLRLAEVLLLVGRDREAEAARAQGIQLRE